jgi:hypothetical protein
LNYQFDQNEKFEDLKNFISNHTVDKKINYPNSKVKEENLKWNASLFFAKAIHLAKPRERELTLREFNQFRKDYEDRNGQIDTDSLFQKYWFRNVLGKIKISGALSSACYRFSKISDFKDELEFLHQEFEKGIKNLPRNDFDQVRKEYEIRNKLTLDEKGLFEPQWLSFSDDHIDISNIDIYFKPYLDHWEDFQFLLKYKEYISNNEEEGLKIDKSDLEQLHETFKQFYTQTPSIGYLTKQLVLHESEEFYYLNFSNFEVRYWLTLGDQISAFYWQLLIEDDHFSDDKERVKWFLQQILYWGWPTNFLFHSLDDTKKRFLDAANNLVINETDLDGIESEFKKVQIDGGIGSSDILSLFHSREQYEDFSLNNSDHFELLESLFLWEKKTNTNYFLGQSSRDELSFLIKVIVAHDYENEREENEDENKSNISHYKRIFSLLEKSLAKPTLLWGIKHNVIMCRREFIPNLIKDAQYTSLAFQFMDRIGEYILHDEKATVYKKLWIRSMELALFSIRSISLDIASKLIFQIYRQLNSNKYDIPNNWQHHEGKLSRKLKEEKEKAVLSWIEDSSLYNYKVHGAGNQFLLPQLFNELVKLFINLPSRTLFNNGSVSFPMLQWDGLAWLMKCSTFWKYKSQFEIIPPDNNTLTNSFFNLYIDRIEVIEVKKYNSSRKQGKGLPLWSEKIERLEYIEWIYPVYFLNKQGNLSRFLAPNFTFKSPTESGHHDWNRFVGEKLRTHIGVLLQVLGQFVLPIIPYGFEKNEIQEIKSRIEQQIVDFLKRHIKDVPEEGRVDLFDYNKEKAFKNSEKEALLPQVARALNWFSKKEQIIEAIIETQDIAKILTISEWVTSIGVKQKLIERIQQSDIKAFLEKKRWTPEVQQILLDIRQYPKLEKEINQVVEFWEKRVSKKNKEYEVQLYQTKMLLAYFHGDEEGLNSISEPDSRIHAVRELSYSDHKQFYRALIRLEKNPESSHAIFRQLSTQYPQYTVFALNQMAAKINIAKSSDDLKIYKEALEEWKAYSNQQKDLDEEALGSTFVTNKLYILLMLGEYDQFDKVFNDLEKPYKMLPDVLEVKIESLIGREIKKVEEASQILDEADNYHKFLGSENISFIQDLKNKVNGVDNVEELHYQYNRIFTSSPKKLIRIFPQDLNGQRQLKSFLVTEIASAAKMMLDKIVTISEIEGEDKYNDLIEILLNSKMNPWGWFVSDQSRGGYSDLGNKIKDKNKTKKKQPGERDFRFFNKKDTFGICEAFIYRTPAPAKKHLKKVFNYYHQRENLIMLIYDLNEPIKAEKNWSKYLKTILPKTDFPHGYEFINCEDLSHEYGQSNSAIRIARSYHKGQISLYHVFVNINYKVNYEIP